MKATILLLLFAGSHLLYSQANEEKQRTSETEKILAISGVALAISFTLDDQIQEWRGDSYSLFLDQYVEPFGREYSLVGSIAFYGYALIAQDRKAAKTSVALGKALVFSYIGSNGLKMIFRRTRPNQLGYDEGAWFQYDQPGNISNSFPSGHSTYASSVATVLVLSYPEEKWLPWAAYGMAGLVGFERVYNGRHHLSDVIAGWTLGYFLGKLALKPWGLDAYFLPGGAGLTLSLD